MSVRICSLTLAVLAAGLAGCGTSSATRTATNNPLPTSGAIAPETQATAPVQPSDDIPQIADGATVPLATLLELARIASPSRELLEANRAAAEATISQARAWSNPELELDLGRATARQADENGQRVATTIGGVSLRQRFELPGKRSARIAAAEAGRSITEQEARRDRLDLEIEVRAAATGVAIADARLAQARHVADLSVEVQRAVERRVQAGETDRGDLARAQSDLASARLASAAAEAEAEATRAALRIWCGQRLPARFTVTLTQVDAALAVDLSEVQRQALDAHPRLAVFAARETAQAATIAAEERAWYPDLTLGVSGGRETDTNDLGVSIGIDLPLWNRNEGGVAQARAEMARNRAERRKELVALQREVLSAWSAYDRERRQIDGFATTVLPATQEALRLKMAAFQAGEAGLLEVIDARRADLAATTALLDARERAASAFNALIAAVGGEPVARSNTTNPSSPAIVPTGVQP